MNRRIVQTRYANQEREVLQTVIVYEPGVNKQSIKQEQAYIKRHDVLIQRGDQYEYRK